MEITCPLCSGTQFTTSKSGLIIKRLSYECLNCKTQLVQEKQGATACFQVAGVGEDYSNCAPLFTDWQAKPAELAHPDLPIYSDQQLIAIAKGEVPEDCYQEAELPELPFKPAEAERLVFFLENVYSWEDRLSQENYKQGYRPRIKPGGWAKVKTLSEPRHAHNTETLALGTLIITTQRYFFSGGWREISHTFHPTTSVIPFINGLGLTSPERLRIEYFKGYYHWPLIASVTLGLIRNYLQNQ